MNTLSQLPSKATLYYQEVENNLKLCYEKVVYIGQDDAGQKVFHVSNPNFNPSLRAIIGYREYKKQVISWHKKYPNSPMGFPKTCTPYYS